jgi:hypothetical protein
MSGFSHKSWWVGGLVASLAFVVAVVVQAAIPDASGVIHACYRANGNLRLVDKSNCTSSETALTWNQMGPQGPAGVPGPAGAPGPQGQPGTSGPSGVAGYEIINTQETLPLNGSIEVTATCPTGKRVISGGYVAPTVLDTASSSRPEGDKGWRVEFKSNGGNGDASVLADQRKLERSLVGNRLGKLEQVRRPPALEIEFDLGQRCGGMPSVNLSLVKCDFDQAAANLDRAGRNFNSSAARPFS